MSELKTIEQVKELISKSRSESKPKLTNTIEGIQQQYDEGLESNDEFFSVYALVELGSRYPSEGEIGRLEFEIVGHWFNNVGDPVIRPAEYLSKMEENASIENNS